MININQKLRVEENRQLTYKTWLMRLSGYYVENPTAGQFVNVAIPGKYLRRPISVHQHFNKEGELFLLYDVAGEGTRELSQIKPGITLDILVGLGNGFSIPNNIEHPLLLGGGIGSAPLYQLALDLVYAGKKPVVVFGFNTKEDVIPGLEGLINEGITTYFVTVDGSLGDKGFVTDVIRERNIKYDYFYACGPMPMLKALSGLPGEGELSLECRMGCGFGACVCCSLETKNGVKRICKEGPVFKKDEVIWK